MQIGYVRVSTNEQNTDLQRNALVSSGCELIFEDKMSGKSTERPGLRRTLKRLSAGDTLVVWKLDRLGRSMKHLVMLIEELRQRGVSFKSLTDSIDTSTSMGRFFFHVMSALAERTRAGLAAAREKGRIGGRKRVMTTDIVSRARNMFSNGATLRQVALVLEVSEKTVYKYIPASEQRELRGTFMDSH